MHSRHPQRKWCETRSTADSLVVPGPAPQLAHCGADGRCPNRRPGRRRFGLEQLHDLAVGRQRRDLALRPQARASRNLPVVVGAGRRLFDWAPASSAQAWIAAATSSRVYARRLPRLPTRVGMPRAPGPALRPSILTPLAARHVFTQLPYRRWSVSLVGASNGRNSS